VISCIIQGLGGKEIQLCGILMQCDRANNDLELQAHNPQQIMCYVIQQLFLTCLMEILFSLIGWIGWTDVGSSKIWFDRKEQNIFSHQCLFGHLRIMVVILKVAHV
jgi:hypothetical protein